MKKILTKVKKWISGITASMMLVAVVMPAVAFAVAPIVGVDTLITNDTTPKLTGTVNDASADISVTVDSNLYPATNNGDGTWVLADDTIVSLFDGIYDVVASATNNDGTSVDGSFNELSIDTAAPVVSGVIHGMYYNVDVVPTFTEGIAVLKYSGNTDSFISGATVSAEDTYVLEVTDTASNTVTVVFTIDKTVPEIILNGANPFNLERGDLLIDPGATADTGESVTSVVLVDNDTIGDYAITYNAVDLAGNVAIERTRDVYVRDTIGPTVDAGTDKVTNLIVYQDATASDFPFAISSYLWEQVSGPGTVTFGPDTIREDVVFLADEDGIYNLRLTVEDAGGNLSSDEMQLVWDTTGPAVDVGSNIVANLPFTPNAVTSDDTSGINSYLWTQEDGPGVVSFTNPDAEDSLMSASIDGIYTIRLTVTDNAGNIEWSEFTLTWDTIAPKVENLKVVVDYDPYLDGENGFSIEAEVSDEGSGVNTFKCEYTLDGSNWVAGKYLTGKCFVEGLTVVDGTELKINMRVQDNAGNQGMGVGIFRIADNDVIGDIGQEVEEEEVIACTTYYEEDVIEEEDETEVTQEIKSGASDTEEDEEGQEETSDTEVPAFGIVVLVLLIMLGIYLLYLQNPELFKKMAFWNRNKK